MFNPEDLFFHLMFLSNCWRTKSILKKKKTLLLRKYHYIYVYTFYKALLKDSSLPTTILQKKKAKTLDRNISASKKTAKKCY